MSQTRLIAQLNRRETFSRYFEIESEAPEIESEDPEIESQSLPPTSLSDTLRKVTEDEASHYSYIHHGHILRDCEFFIRNKEPHIHNLLYGLCRHVHQIDASDKARLHL
jgi:hypothetical protein